MTLTRAFTAVAICTIVCTVVGTLLGYAAGTFLPGLYIYSGAVAGGRLPWSPHELELALHRGVGFGLNAGIFTGVTVGVILVAIVAYSQIRKDALAASLQEREDRERRLRADELPLMLPTHRGEGIQRP